MENSELELAEQYALHTGRNMFLTGKAGTGKTTLLKKIAEKTTKNFIIVAPTGVAAINAGGVTIHSMFNLPLTSFIPTSDFVDMNIVTNRRVLHGHLRFRKEKVAVLREMEMLIIDEASMVRCDILDAIDFVLRTVRRNQQPFGGVQVMLIGDLHQLPPVVKNPEWEILQHYYRSPFFFEALAWKELDAVEIELKTIFRQRDEKFLHLLNNIRHQEMDEDDFEELKKRYNPLFKPTEEGYILLTTHNRKADSINEMELRKLPGRHHLFEAEITGDFPENMYPCERVLNLKEGAQVMFIRNDAEGGRYYNGRIATIKKIDDEDITVTFNDNHEDYVLRLEIWENIHYSVKPGSEKVEKKELGSFSQFPIRLAWAVTIHKSQGLTFDKVIIDAGQSFAAGQVYVALSRCRTLEGIVLHSLIYPQVIYGDEKILEFTASHHRKSELQNMLGAAKIDFTRERLKRVFNFEKFRDQLAAWRELIIEKEIPSQEKALETCDSTIAQTEMLNITSKKFQPELDRLLSEISDDANKITMLKERCGKAIAYFTENIFNQIITPLHEHIRDFAFKSRVKRYVQFAQSLEDYFWNKMHQLYEAGFLNEPLYSGEKRFTKESFKTIDTANTSKKKEKGATYKDTLTLYKQGMKLDEIAAVRSLTLSTIKGHIAKWIQTGEIDIHEVLPENIIQRIEKYLENNQPESFSAIKSHFGDTVDYSDIRMVINHRAKMQGEKKEAD